MGEAIFTGKFLKPAEVFAVQHLDPTHLHRLAPEVFYWIVVIVAVGLAIHFIVASLPGLLRKGGLAKEGTATKEVQVKRRDAAQIAYHWVNAAAIVALTVTGFAIYFGFPDTAGYFLWHLWAAWVLLGALVFHIWYATIRFKHFRRMWVTWDELRETMKRIPGFGGSGAEPAPKHGFYKIEQIAMHWVLTALVLGLVITGFILWKPARDFVGPFWMPWGWDAVFVARVLHQIFTFLLIALVVAHVYFAVLVPQEWPRLKSIFTGRVRLSWYRTQHKVSPQVESRAKAIEAGEAKAMPMPGMTGVQKG
jgi:Ni/Fe-hydrogenase 1 B-type cytochrome subunit